MAAKDDNRKGTESLAIARALNLPVSTKQCIEVCRSVRYKNTNFAKKFLTDVVNLRRAVPFKRHTKDLGHKAGMSAGRYPQKAAQELLKLISSAEANAQVKGLNTSDMRITKLIANKASIPLTGGRLRHATRRTHLEIEVAEGKGLRPKAVNVKKVETPMVEPAKEKKEETVLRQAKKSEEAKKPEAKPEAEKEFISKPAERMAEAEEVMKESRMEEKKGEPEIRKPMETVRVEREVPEQKIVQKAAQQSAKEPSSEELLRRAQERAAELNRLEKQKKANEEVSKLYGELQKKGTLRTKGDNKK